MPWVRGDKLTPALKKQVLAGFIYRWTSDNQERERVWTKLHSKPRIPLVTDEEWLKTHVFHVLQDMSRLSRNHHTCRPEYYRIPGDSALDSTARVNMHRELTSEEQGSKGA